MAVTRGTGHGVRTGRRERSGSVDAVGLISALPHAALAGSRLIVVDERRLLAESVRGILETHGAHVLGIVSDAAEAVALSVEGQPDLAILDLEIAEAATLGTAITDVSPATKLVALLGRGECRRAREALDVGFQGCLSLHLSARQFVSAVAAILDGQFVVSEGMTTVFGTSAEERNAAVIRSRLTQREKEILRLLADGASSEAIAEQLWISRNTVRTHIKRLLGKLRAHSRLEAVSLAVRYGILDRSTLN